MKNTILLLFISLLLFSNGFSQEQNASENFDFGTTEAGLYKNTYFNLEVPFDSTWSVQTPEQIKNLSEIGEEYIIGNDTEMKRMIKASKINVSTLLVIYKYEVGTAVDYNPSFMLVAENTRLVPGVKTGKDYLFHSKRVLEVLDLNYTFNKEIYKKKINDFDFYVLEAKATVMGVKVQQDYIATVVNGFTLLFITSYNNKKDRKELYDEIINKIKLKP